VAAVLGLSRERPVSLQPAHLAGTNVELLTWFGRTQGQYLMLELAIQLGLLNIFITRLYRSKQLGSDIPALQNKAKFDAYLVKDHVHA
jgi:hypothetical protein